MSSFEEDYKLAEYVEERVLKIIQRKYPKAFIPKTDTPFSDWDIYIPEISEGIEVKSDYESKITGNIVIEIEMRGKPTALSVTKAKYWVITDGYRLIWVKPIEIYRHIALSQLNRACFVGRGDDTSKLGFFLIRNNFVKYVTKLKKEDGFITMIDKNDELYYDNIDKIFNLNYG